MDGSGRESGKRTFVSTRESNKISSSRDSRPGSASEVEKKSERGLNRFDLKTAESPKLSSSVLSDLATHFECQEGRA